MADYQAILDAIDAAVLVAVAGPGTLTAAGQTIVWRSLDELRASRKEYAALLAGQATTTPARIGIARFAGGSAE